MERGWGKLSGSLDLLDCGRGVAWRATEMDGWKAGWMKGGMDGRTGGQRARNIFFNMFCTFVAFAQRVDTTLRLFLSLSLSLSLSPSLALIAVLGCWGSGFFFPVPTPFSSAFSLSLSLPALRTYLPACLPTYAACLPTLPAYPASLPRGFLSLPYPVHMYVWRLISRVGGSIHDCYRTRSFLIFFFSLVYYF